MPKLALSHTWICAKPSSPEFMDPFNLRWKFECFRILIIGRVNAGKTTILQRVCNTRENHEIYNSAGEKIDPTILMASRERGQHDIENEMVFRNNPGFVFHDSCGFEAGGNQNSPRYCIPMDEESRSWTEGEVKFFSQCDTGSIPVVVLFTKFDALYDDEFAELTSKGESRENAKRLASMRIRESFMNGPQVKLLYNREGNRHPPNCHICLADMNMDDADCGHPWQHFDDVLTTSSLRDLIFREVPPLVQVFLQLSLVSIVTRCCRGFKVSRMFALEPLHITSPDDIAA
ncbi:hypothetical protein EV702DRAFT_1196818 [Suillus placidus]|uniref:G domain-containing protein n=1 Tax=Suillus placidus TaxID=48579 RepID=A0A9P6ZXL3_9AGAM|nr:hypothetical protein EV702DRAFT_1196818 [Suillus placidus]